MTVDTFSTFFALLTVAANAAVVTVVSLALAGRFSATAREGLKAVRDSFGPVALKMAWLVAAVATAGSLYYSEIANFTPCKLCWYQRIGMYPLVVILGIAAAAGDVAVKRYVLPLVAAAGAISVYHYQLERFPQQASFACTAEAPCTLVWVWKFHYISIPFMALSAFAFIAAALLIARPPHVPGAPARADREPVTTARRSP